MNCSSGKFNTYVDFDDTMCNSVESFVKTYNEYYVRNGCISKLNRWDFKCVYPDITQEQLWYIFGSKNFFKNLTIKKHCREVLIDNIDFYNYHICTIGTSQNLKLKEEFISENFKDIFGDFKTNTFCGINNMDSRSKGSIDMAGCLQMDDRIDSLTSTNSKVKLLFKERDYEWNDEKNIEDIYRISNWEDVDSIFKFYKSTWEII